jgi:hypothetical protein
VWRDEEKAKRSALMAVGIWTFLFIELAIILLTAERVIRIA